MSLKSGLLEPLCKQGSSSGDEGGPRHTRIRGPLLCASKSVRNQADIRKVCTFLKHSQLISARSHGPTSMRCRKVTTLPSTTLSAALIRSLASSFRPLRFLRLPPAGFQSLRKSRPIWSSRSLSSQPSRGRTLNSTGSSRLKTIGSPLGQYPFLFCPGRSRTSSFLSYFHHDMLP
jgi:hypothetical protein